MATIRKRAGKWQAQIRRTGTRHLSKSVLIRKDAETWARQMEARADRDDLPVDVRQLTTGMRRGEILAMRWQDVNILSGLRADFRNRIPPRVAQRSNGSRIKAITAHLCEQPRDKRWSETA